MSQYFEGLISQFRLANGNNGLWFLALSALIYLLLFEKEKRRRFTLPALILTLAVLNPLTFMLFKKLKLAYVYWRVFWLIPIVPVLAGTGVCLAERTKKGALRILLTLLLLVIISITGFSAYLRKEQFRHLDNPYRIDERTAIVGSVLLELEPEPYVVPTPTLGVGLRQFSSRIHQMYGRDLYGFIGQADELSRQVAEEVMADDPDLDLIYRAMQEKGYDYLVRVYRDGDTEERFLEAGFEKVREVEIYIIYKLTHRG